MRDVYRLLIVGVCAVLMTAGCAKRAQPVAAAPPPPAAAAREEPAPPPPPPARAEVPPAPAAAFTEDELFARKTLDELNAERPLAVVYFAYDEFTIRDEARPVLQRNAEWLRRWPSTRASVEGHADERGTNEYNLALAERRGHAVREYLIALGIGGDRLAVVAMGEEAPVCVQTTETCWQQNRRGQFVLTAK